MVFESRYANYYRDCIEALVAAGQPREAFHIQERSRARSFLALLVERDLRFPNELPSEVDREKKRIDTEYDRTQAALARLSPARDEQKIEELLGRLRDLRESQNEIVATIRKSSPRFASLRYPEPLDAAKARDALDPGTVLLSYSVADHKTFLFVLQAAGPPDSGLKIFTLPIGAHSLREEVESFRNILRRHDLSNFTILKAQARRLYEILVKPAEEQIAASERILISLDGPLHTLPFAALRRGNRYLVEWKPVHSVLSATVYAEMTKSRPARRDPGTERLTAFGDPVYRSLTPNTPTDPELREAIRRGLSLLPLPSSGREVKSIAALYPGAQVYLGRNATEEKAKSIGSESNLVHFACHGLLDERFPLNSALALTLPEPPAEGRDNGLLQAWEVFESVHLDADLVTLSACDTALGREMGGEGLVGLTRAFQYAGARSVLASLWSVADLSTARFMKRFYGHLRDGKTKDEALRAAQIDQIREGARSSHPFHWGAFQLTGDWR